MTETLLELEANLVQAKEARHRLLTGSLEVSINLHEYGSTTYNAGNIKALEKYILELKQEIAKQNGTSRRGIIRSRF